MEGLNGQAGRWIVNVKVKVNGAEGIGPLKPTPAHSG